MTDTKKVGYQGMEGSYSHQACQAFAPDQVSLGFQWFDGLCAALHRGEIEQAVIPVENIITGDVTPALHALSDYKFRIVTEQWMPIVHCWLSKQDTHPPAIKSVASHYQALAQCSLFIERRQLNPVEMFDTAGAAAWLAGEGDGTCSVIASELAGRLYGLKVIDSDIANRKDNKTKFRILEKHRP